MSRGKIVLSILLLLIAMLVFYIAQNSYWIKEPIVTPLKGEARRNPYYAIQKLAQKLGAQAEWRQGLVSLPPTDGVMVLTAWHWDLLPSRRDALKRWVENGGRLVTDDTLINARGDLSVWAGIDFQRTKSETTAFVKPVYVKSKPCRPVDVKQGAVADGRKSFLVCTWDTGDYPVARKPPLWSLEDAYGVFATRVAIGKGSLTFINAPAPFQHQRALEGDHPQLFVAATQLRKGDRLYLISDNDFESLLSLMWRYGAPVIVLALALVALALWRGSARFGPLSASPEAARRSLGEQIRGTGWFTVRHGGGAALRTAAVRALFETARLRIVNFDSLPAEERVNALAKVSGAEATVLAEAINFSGPRRPGDLRDTIVLLETARRTILNRTGSTSRL